MNNVSQSAHGPVSVTPPPLWRRVLAGPRTSPGRWSLGLLAGGVTALLAIIRKGERSIVMGLPLLVAGFVLFFAIGELLEF